MSRLSRIGLPLSIVSSTASSRECFCTSRAMRIQISRTRMRSERPPSRRRRPRRFHRGVNVGRRALRDRRELLAIRGIDGVEILSRRRRLPCAADEMLEAPSMTLQPRDASFESSGAGPYSMLTNFSAMLIGVCSIPSESRLRNAYLS